LINEDVGRLQQLRGARMTLLPFRQAGERFLLILALTHFDQRKLRDAPSLGRLHPRRLTGLLAIVRRPRRIALPFLLLAC